MFNQPIRAFAHQVDSNAGRYSADARHTRLFPFHFPLFLPQFHTYCSNKYVPYTMLRMLRISNERMKKKWRKVCFLSSCVDNFHCHNIASYCYCPLYKLENDFSIYFKQFSMMITAVPDDIRIASFFECMYSVHFRCIAFLIQLAPHCFIRLYFVEHFVVCTRYRCIAIIVRPTNWPLTTALFFPASITKLQVNCAQYPYTFYKQVG